MNNIKTVMLMVLMAVIMMLIGGLVGGRTGLTIMLFFSIAMNIYSYWCSDSLVLRWSGAQEVTREQAPQLYDLVEKLASRAGLPMPRVCIIDADEPNAFATGRNPEHAAVAVTTGIMRVLDYNEISGVLAHELAHVKNRDILTSTIASMMATVISYAAQFFMFFGGSSDDDDGVNPIAAIAMMILAPIAAMLIQMAISRSREYEADHDGGEICGNPNYLADGLEKIEYYVTHSPETLPDAKPATANMYIVNPFEGTGKALTKLFSTHPDTSDRIARLREQAREMRVY
ncbi:zinc metalloprotease HtpX [Mitsuokella jalaludinii]|uniref:zinc metalloprotease HtpX n=1 Tax=Mitsuokella jalaludinii TaxID=187979 RepID=UPI00242F1977|nr:zinc metalloprotease HtpX [Mitsuokella jalaludinii]MCI7185161.1 zinc metalloprotease HtpX [Mitsuokella jalaludinii]MCI7716909.1 zinc metalloprotease HtpX [Mitsuokella jalaludinii]MDD7745907.1 zinc metalloprotease HtpX [Mitsuokella jalaludinii]